MLRAVTTAAIRDALGHVQRPGEPDQDQADTSAAASTEPKQHDRLGKPPEVG